MPARRPAALVGAATVLAAGALVGATAVPAHATGDKGSASAVNARVDLDVTLLKGTKVPVSAVLNEVEAPESEQNTVLKAKVKGAYQDRPFTFVSAKVAKAIAKTEAGKAAGSSEIVEARVHVPGLAPLLHPVLKADLITADAICEVGKKPVAKAYVPGKVTVLGKQVTLDARGTADVEVKGVGKVHLALSEEEVTTNTAAATAIHLNVMVKPGKPLGVAAVDGHIVVSQAKCTTPGSGGDNGGSTAGTSGADNGGSTAGTSGADNGGSTAGTSGADSGGSTAGTSGADNGGSTAGTSGADSGGSTAGTSGADSGGSTAGTSGQDSGGSGDTAGNMPDSKGGSGNLAETGGGNTILLGGVAAVLIAGGGAALWMKRRASAGS